MKQYNVSYETHESVGALAVITIGDVPAESPAAAVAVATMILPTLVGNMSDWDYVGVMSKESSE